MSDQELFELNRRGLIPGPTESEEAFVGRIKAIETFLSSSSFAGEKVEKIPDCDWDWARHHLFELYDFQPSSLFAFYSNRDLPPWQGAASWIMDVRPGPLSAIQLRKGFRKGKYLFYSRDEILAHEAVHAARSAFEEPGSEEFFAYGASPVVWRRVLGPIVRRPWEVWLFLAVLCIGAFSGNFLLPAALLAMAFFRLIFHHFRFRRAAKTLQNSGVEPATLRPILFRLTDAEILRLARGEMLEDDDSLRFRVIKQYLNLGGNRWRKE